MTELSAGGKNTSVRERRVGSVTAGLTLIVFGLLFLLHMFVDNISYRMILQLWPVILISLGIEILISQVQKGRAYVYDKGAVVIMIFMMVFAMIMAFFGAALELERFWCYL